MKNDLLDKIKKEIEKSGFPSELYVLNICSKKNTGRIPNIRYKHEGNLRKIDLYAFFEEITPDPKEGENVQHTITAMIIECKKSKDKECPEVEKQLWGGELLGDGYFVRSVGDKVTCKVIRRYIKYQHQEQLDFDF